MEKLPSISKQNQREHDMKTKEKAEKLVNKYLDIEDTYDYISYSMAKKCALIAIDEIINTLTDVMWINNEHTELAVKTKYWYEIKQEIEKL